MIFSKTLATRSKTSFTDLCKKTQIREGKQWKEGANGMRVNYNARTGLKD